MYEFPKGDGDPYYPIPRAANTEMYKQYQRLADSMTNTYFVGRLATYKYYNMDQVVAQALTTFKKITEGQHEALGHEPAYINEKRSIVLPLNNLNIMPYNNAL